MAFKILVMRLLLLCALVIVLIFFASQRMLNPQLNHNSVTDRLQHPLDTRLRYRIGHVDPRFNISPEQLQNLAQQATDIWFLGTQKQFFVYDPNAQLSINLIYDQRQADTEARNTQITHIEQHRTYTDNERHKLNQLESELNVYKQQIDQLKTNYQDKLNHYNQQVEKFNQSQQSRSQANLGHLNFQKQQLQYDQQQLEQQIEGFNQKVAVLNTQVDNVNQMNQQFNQSVDEFNHRFQPRLFDKGLFNGLEINIYEFQSEHDLRLTLAHEFGHALGLNHSAEPHSLMYPVLEQQDFKNFRLTTADLALLENRP